MADKNNYTTIRIKESSRQKLDLIRQGTDLTFSDIIENLLQHYGGVVTDDVENISRERIALELRYTDFKSDFAFYEITFAELHDVHVGQTFHAKANPSAESYTNEFAEVIWMNTESVLLRVTEVVVEHGKMNKFVKVININLF